MEKRQIIFDKWWGIGAAAFSLLFVGWFVVSELEGLKALVDLLINAISNIPDAIGTVIDYYSSISFRTLSSSIVIGGMFGVISTTLVLLSARNKGEFPVFSGRFWGQIAKPEMIRLMPYIVIIGVAAGGIGSQILAYPMQHCTYTDGVSNVQRWIGYGITIVSALIMLLPIWTIWLQRTQPVNQNRSTSGYFRNIPLAFAFLAPTLISLMVFLYYPATQVATLSLKAQLLRRERFVCLDNYINLSNDVIYRNSFLVTLMLTAAIVVFSMSAALMIAVLASQKVRGASIYRTLLIWPYALSPVITGAIFLTLFRQGRSGLINYALYETLGVTTNWFTDPDLAPWVIVFTSVWNAMGFNILFYIAGLQNVPKDLLEAAQIDGANRLQRFIRITFPLLSPFTFFLLITNITYSFYGIYGAVDILTQGGPPLGVGGRDGGATNVLIYKLYEDAFSPSTQVGGAAAQSIVLFALVALITLVQFGYLERRVTYAE